MRMKNNWPTTVDELVDECEWLKCRYDLYTLGKRDEPFLGKGEPMIDGTDYLAGEYQYGVAMVPAQWVTSVLGDMEDAWTCQGEIDSDYFECKLTTFKCHSCGWSGVVDSGYAGYSFEDTDMPRHCPNCGSMVVDE